MTIEQQNALTAYQFGLISWTQAFELFLHGSVVFGASRLSD